MINAIRTTNNDYSLSMTPLFPGHHHTGCYHAVLLVQSFHVIHDLHGQFGTGAPQR